MTRSPLESRWDSENGPSCYQKGRNRPIPDSSGPPSAEDLDGVSARRGEVERPRAVLSRWRGDVEPVVLQSAVDLIHARFALLDESDVKRGRVLDRRLLADLH